MNTSINQRLNIHAQYKSKPSTNTYQIMSQSEANTV
jgi:hypothetical protein